jgi:hypothetical protein
MAKAWVHAESSAKRWGGKPEGSPDGWQLTYDGESSRKRCGAMSTENALTAQTVVGVTLGLHPRFDY